MTKKNLPAIRYAAFDDVFVEHVTRVQNNVRSVEALRPYHAVVREVLAAAELTNEARIALVANGLWAAVTVDIFGTPSDELATFESLAKAIGAELKVRELHATGDAQQLRGGFLRRLEWTWKSSRQRGYRRVELCVECENGLRDMEWLCHIRKYEDYDYRAIARVPRIHTHSAYQVVADQRDIRIGTFNGIASGQ
jgi:hypothetical protein